jgi:hypothetical protein
MTFHYLPIIVLIFAVSVVAGLKLIRPHTNANGSALRARLPVSPVEQQLYRRLVDAFPECIVLCQVAISQLVTVVPGPGRQTAFNKISRLVADFVLCTADFAVVHVIELDDSSHAAPHRKNADRNKSEALAAAGYSLIRFRASKLPTPSELRAALPMPSPVVASPAREKKGVRTG